MNQNLNFSGDRRQLADKKGNTVGYEDFHRQ